MEESEKNAPLGHENTSVKTEIIAFHLILLSISSRPSCSSLLFESPLICTDK